MLILYALRSGSGCRNGANRSKGGEIVSNDEKVDKLFDCVYPFLDGTGVFPWASASGGGSSRSEGSADFL
ncbi:hypothetical protein EYF80_040395 [Liparis tanakae]|uniref:Uncharacterized protein n=1 Tax=Liparis tanakae TaxID=230148 RepID=A0A4Z2G8V2_9TELE|nr:hypothetical protein EYF80_040395 [Liparis tanakae]